MGKPVPEGSLYYDTSRHRRIVQFSDDLRVQVLATVEAVRQLLISEQLPPPVADGRCPKCSLIDACMPYALKGFARASKKNGLFVLSEP